MDDLMMKRIVRAVGAVQTWDGETIAENWTRSEIEAVIKAVLEAVREPSNAMLDSFVSRALQVSIHGEGGWSEYGRNQWQAMIDAALRELSSIKEPDQ